MIATTAEMIPARRGKDYGKGSATLETGHKITVYNFSTNSIEPNLYVWLSQDPQERWFITAADVQ